MKRLLLFFCLASAPSFAQNASDIEGIWYMHPDKRGRTALAKVFAQDGKYAAFSFAYTNAPGKEPENPPKISSKGLIFLKNLEFSEGLWAKGTMDNPENGKSFHARAKLSADKNTLTIRASVDGAGLFGVTFIWHRADPKYAPLAQGVAPFYGTPGAP